MSVASDGVLIPPPIPIVDDNPEMDDSVENYGRNPASKRNVSSDDERPSSHRSSSSAQALSKRSKTKGSEGNTPINKSLVSPNKCDSDSEANDVEGDTKLFALAEKFYNEEWVEEWDDGPLAPGTKNLLIKFAVSVHKHLATVTEEQSNSDNDVAGLRNLMYEGFQAMTARLERLEKVHSEGKPPVEKVDPVPNNVKESYANMVTKLKEAKPDASIKKRIEEIKEETTPKNYTVLDLEEKVDDEGFQVVKRKLQRSLKGKNVKVDRLVKTAKGNVSMEFASNDEQKKVETILSRTNHLGATIRSTQNKLVSIALRGIPRELTEEEVRVQLVDRNPEFDLFKTTNWSLKLIKPSDRRSSYQIGKITTNLDSAKELLEAKKLYIDLQAIKTELWKPNHSRCAKCLKSGHTARNCQDLRCVYCAGSHLSKDCHKKTWEGIAKCIICSRSQQNAKDRATMKECPVLIQETTDEYWKICNYVYG